MKQTPTPTRSPASNAPSKTAPIFGLYYLEEQEFDLNEVVGCFGVRADEGPPQFPHPTQTCPGDDYDVEGCHA